MYGHNDGSSSIPSILKSTEALPGSKALLLSISRPDSLPEGIVWKKIPPLNYQQYSLFMIYCLASFINTDFALCVQADSWVLNQSAWTDKFLEYDYIGAPNEVGLIKPKSESDPGFQFEGMLLRAGWGWMAEKDPIYVLNGGFSLRSKKLLNTPRDIGVAYIFDDNPIRQNEDLQLCLFMRSQLETHGIKFPPMNVAKDFAIEICWPHQSKIDFNNIFGIHCPYNMALIERKKIIHTGALDGRHASLKFTIDFLRELGYEFIFR